MEPFGSGARGGSAGAARRTAVAALLLAAGACATTGSLQQQRGDGLTRFYRGSFEEIWQAAVHAVRANNLQLDRTDRSGRFIAATHVPGGTPVGAPDESVAISADQGERIGIFVDSIKPGTWGVEVVTTRRFALDPTTRTWKRAIFLALERELDPEARLPGPLTPDSAAASDTARGNGGG